MPSSSWQKAHFVHAESSTHVPSRDDESASYPPSWGMSDIASGHHLSCPPREGPRPTQHSIKSELTESPDFRILRRSPELPPQISSSSSTPTPSAISASYNTRNIISSSQDVPPVVNSSAFYLSSPVTRTDAFSNYLGPSVSSSSSTPSYNVLTTRRQRPRTSNQVFTAPHGKIAPRGIPKSLPPAPSTAPRRTDSTEPDLSEFTALSNNYLNMLAQKPTDNSMDANHVTSALPSFAPEDVQSILDVITGSSSNTMSSSTSMPPPPTPQTPELWSSPAWSDANDFNVSPDTDFLNTPVFGDNNDDMLTGMFNDGDFEGGALFPSMEEYPMYEKPAHAALPTLEGLIIMTPESPALHDFNPTVDPSSLYPSPFLPPDASFPSPTPAAPIRDVNPPVVSVPTVVQPSVPAPRRRFNATGTRKGVTPEGLVSVDAPTQPRKYVLPSATSRKEVPLIFAKKRSRSSAFGEEEDEFTEPPPGPDASEREQIEYKRRQNTVAARRSRKRKLEYQRDLEATVDRLKMESEAWKTRAKLYHDMLRSNGIQLPPFTDVIED